MKWKLNMIPNVELDKVIEIAKKYQVGKLYLVGSSLYNSESAHEYDFAVLDVPEGTFFLFYGELFGTMAKNVNLIDLSGMETRFKKLVVAEGKLVYDKTIA